MKIFFMRHGDYKEKSLTRIGKKQVKFSSYYLKRENIKAIYASPTMRCQQTARIVSKNLKLPVTFIPNLKEREKIVDIVTDDDKEWYDNYMNTSYSHQSPEGAKEFFERVRNSIIEIVKSHKEDENIVFIGHSSNAYAIISLFFKSSNPASWIALGNASIIAFEYFNGEFYTLNT